MGPKKAVTVVDPPVTETTGEEKEKETDAETVRKVATHPSTAIMVREAIEALDSRKGVSSQAIQNYIKQKYNPSGESVRLKGLVRKALKKGIDNGTLVRPANSTMTSGAAGRFRIAPKSKGPKAKSENVDPNVQKAPKAAKDGTKGEDKKKKKTDAKIKGPNEDKSSEEPKPEKKSKKDDKEVSVSKVAPVKKPKAKKAAKTGEEVNTEPVKPKGKAAKVLNEEKEKPEKTRTASQNKKGGKAVQSKSQSAKSDGDAPATKGKRGKKASE